MRFERRILLLALLAGAPGVAVGLVLMWTSAGRHDGAWTLTVLITATWLGAAFAVRERAIRPLQTLSNLLGALREGDFSIRARGARGDDALGLAYLEVNALSEMLRQQRLGALEATALLRAVMEEIEVAVLAFDEEPRLRLVNRAAERLLGRPAPRLLGLTAEELGLDEYLTGPAPRTFRASFAGGSGSWELRRSSFRQGGLPHQLMVLTDLSRALREEEREAWKRLIRVLSHEINNSLAPISSIAGSLEDLLRQDTPPPDLLDDVQQGLGVIRSRSGALARFMTSYSRLARLPAPRRQPLDVGGWVRRVAALEPRVEVRVHPGPELQISADGDQLDQLLINLVRNAADAALETGGGVEVAWTAADGHLTVSVDDEGPGLVSTANLFVPFFTTKPSGSGIGLALSRQIAEAHGGTLDLRNRCDGPGCRALLRLPTG
jgi:nitrogen fixation/metabolism regulation signal transduction histidine kinase